MRIEQRHVRPKDCLDVYEVLTPVPDGMIRLGGCEQVIASYDDLASTSPRWSSRTTSSPRSSRASGLSTGRSRSVGLERDRRESGADDLGHQAPAQAGGAQLPHASRLPPGGGECAYDYEDPCCWETVSTEPDTNWRPRGISWMARWDQIYDEGFRRVEMSVRAVGTEPAPPQHKAPKPSPGYVVLGGPDSTCAGKTVWGANASKEGGS